MTTSDQARGAGGVDLAVRRVAGRIGAEVRNVRLSSDLNPATAEKLRAALYEHKVIFLRGQHHLDDAVQEALTPLFGGEPVSHPTIPAAAGSRHVLELDSHVGGGRANSWHTDVTFVDAYPAVSILRAVEIPACGGDTVWANTAAAYLDLPPHLRELADKLWAVHSNAYDYAGQRPKLTEADKRRYNDVFTSTVYEAEHPVVQLHPVTGERALILGHFVRRLVGVTSTDSAHLFSIFQDHIIRLENTVRWQWAVGDVAIWDNRATQHYAINDYADQRRIVHRVTVDGPPAVSIDGRSSVLLKPAPRQASPAAA